MMDRLTVYIGRFSPFHQGHAYTLKRALQSSDRVLVIIGSAGQARTIKNPWSYEERQGLIRSWSLSDGAGLSESERNRLIFAPLIDTPYNDQIWLSNVQKSVNAALSEMPEETEVFLTGADKDDSSYYLHMFPSYKMDLCNAALHQDGTPMAATAIRDKYFSGSPLPKILPETASFLAEFKIGSAEAFGQLVREYDHIQAYKTSWASVPYAPTFHTVDAVVVQNGHILLTQRKHEPGRGLYALPGGFIGVDESLFDACIRELREETRLKVPDPILRSNFVRREIFDAPGRSLRGRTITTAHLFSLNPNHDLHPVKGSDDAEWAGWVELGQISNMRASMFEDHFDIIETMISGIL
jgi:bifunctional NMN adenylyltransferase/nudix hydrolase